MAPPESATSGNPESGDGNSGRRHRMSNLPYLLSAADAVRQRSLDAAVVFLYLPGKVNQTMV